MKVTFTRTAERRYRVSVDGPGIIPSHMEPAPGYDARMPHDMAHFIVEDEFRISGGVFGQLAAGGHASTFTPDDHTASKRKERTGDRISAANRDDALLSERLVDIVQKRWLKHPDPAVPVKGVTDAQVDRACERFEEISSKWAQIRIGEGLTFEWLGRKAGPPPRKKR